MVCERHIFRGRTSSCSISSSCGQGVPTLAPPCKLVRDPSDRLRVPRSTAILCSLSKSDRVVLITPSSPSGYTPVRPECPDTPSSSCLLIKMWQLTKAHRVTRNQPKIHVICYITIQIFRRFLYFAFLNIHRWFNIIDIIPHCPDDGSLEPKRYNVDFASQ